MRRFWLTQYPSSSQHQITKNQNQLQHQTIYYEQLTKIQLVKEIRNKDKIIASLKQNIKNQHSHFQQKLHMYRQKLQEQISHNEKSVKAFENITQLILQILKKSQFVDQTTRDSVVTIMHESRGPQALIEQRHDSTEFNCIEEIINQTTKLLEYLSKLTDQNVNFVLKLKVQFINLKQQKEKINECQNEILLLKKQIHSSIIQNKNLKKLLSQNQKEKNKLLTNINSTTDQQIMLQLGKASSNQLMENIKKLIFRIKQLQVDKRKICAQFLVEKQAYQKSYQALLCQVKNIKSKINMGSHL